MVEASAENTSSGDWFRKSNLDNSDEPFRECMKSHITLGWCSEIRFSPVKLEMGISRVSPSVSSDSISSVVEDEIALAESKY